MLTTTSTKKRKHRLIVINTPTIMVTTKSQETEKDKDKDKEKEQYMLSMIYELTKRYDQLESKYIKLQQSVDQCGEKVSTLPDWLQSSYSKQELLSPFEFFERHFIATTEDILRLENCSFTDIFSKILSKMDWQQIQSPIVFVHSVHNTMYWKQEKWDQMSKSNITSVLTFCKKIIFGAAYKYRQLHYDKIRKNEQLEKKIDLILLKITDANFSILKTYNKILSLMKKYMFVNVPNHISKK